MADGKMTLGGAGAMPEPAKLPNERPPVQNVGPGTSDFQNRKEPVMGSTSPIKK